MEIKTYIGVVFYWKNANYNLNYPDNKPDSFQIYHYFEQNWSLYC